MNEEREIQRIQKALDAIEAALSGTRSYQLLQDIRAARAKMQQLRQNKQTFESSLRTIQRGICTETQAALRERQSRVAVLQEENLEKLIQAIDIRLLQVKAAVSAERKRLFAAAAEEKCAFDAQIQRVYQGLAEKKRDELAAIAQTRARTSAMLQGMLAEIVAERQIRSDACKRVRSALDDVAARVSSLPHFSENAKTAHAK